MSITKVQTPHEFLIRWDDAGKLKGGHIAFREAIVEAGEEIASKFLDPQPVALAGEVGFPLADVLGLVNVTALADAEARAAQIAALEAAHKTALDEATAKVSAAESALAQAKEQADAALAAAQEQVAALTGQLNALRPAADVNWTPQSISKRQGRAQLKADGLLAATEGYIFSLPADDTLRMDYEDAAVWDRQNPGVIAMLGMLGKGDADADAFFVAAAARA